MKSNRSMFVPRRRTNTFAGFITVHCNRKNVETSLELMLPDMVFTERKCCGLIMRHDSINLEKTDTAHVGGLSSSYRD